MGHWRNAQPVITLWSALATTMSALEPLVNGLHAPTAQGTL